MRRDFALQFVCFIFLLATTPYTLAEGINSSQMHARLGGTAGSYDGPLTGGFLSPAVDFEYEVFKSNSFSYAFRALLALEMPIAKPHYTYFGLGARWYLDSKGAKVEIIDARTSILSRPTWRHYLAVDVGVSQVIIQTFGDVLQIVSSMVELGGGAGTIYQVNNDFGVEARLALTTGYGFTSIALIGVTATGLVGLVYYY